MMEIDVVKQYESEDAVRTVASFSDAPRDHDDG